MKTMNELASLSDNYSFGIEKQSDGWIAWINYKLREVGGSWTAYGKTKVLAEKELKRKIMDFLGKPPKIDVK